MTMNSFLQKYRAVLAPDGPAGGTPTDTSGSSGSSSAPSSPASSPGTSPSEGTGGASGGSPTTTPDKGAATAPSSSAPPSSGESLDFESIFGDSSQGVIPAPSPPQQVQPPPPASAQAPAVTPPVPAEPQAALAQAAQTPPAAPGEPAAAQPQQPQTPDASAPPALDRYDPGQLARHLQANQAQAIDYVAENVFKLSPQEVEALETDVVGTVPKLLAKAYVMAQQNVLTQLASMVPTMIQRQTEVMKRHAQNEDKFYSRWPDIKKDQHGDLVMKYGAVYRQMHPTASLEQMVEDLGPMIMMAAKIVPQSPQAAGVGRTPAPAAPTNGSAGRTPPPSPFVPAGAGPVSTGTQQEVAPWEAIFQQSE